MQDHQKIAVRVNGKGNAWPVLLGKKSNFYDTTSSDDLSSASFSIIASREGENGHLDIEWEVLVDAGHHTPQFLIKNNNRIPEALVLTHGHPDHVLGVEWVAQSFYKTHDKAKQYPIYATRPVWEMASKICPRLKEVAAFKELVAGAMMSIVEVEGLQVTAFPVFHGEKAFGASMLFFEHDIAGSILFSGDMLCPLLRKKDYELLSMAQTMFVDTNNRFPYPKTNHGSFVAHDPSTKEQSIYLQEFINKISYSYLTAPHARTEHNLSHHNYFDELQLCFTIENLPYSIIDFVKKTGIKNVHLVHYSGAEDEKYYQQQQLAPNGLMEWANQIAQEEGLEDVQFIVPKVGQFFELKSEWSHGNW